MNSKNEIRAAWQRVVIDNQPTVELMLGMGLSTTAEQLNRDIEFFLNRVQSRAHGRRWSEMTASRRVWAVGFHEHPDTNHHVHLALRCSPQVEGRLATDGCRMWKAIRMAGDYHVDRIRNLEDYASYITKDAWTVESQASVYLYQPTNWRER